MIGRQILFKNLIKKRMNTYQLIAYTFLVLFIGFLMGYYA